VAGEFVSLFWKRSTFGLDAAGLVARGTQGRLSGRVTSDRAMQHSAVWACVRLRADLISTSPVDCYRNAGGHKLDVPTPQVLVKPGGQRVDVTEWMYSTQADLDRFGNTFGLITERDGARLPARIDLLPAEQVTVVVKQGELAGYRVGATTYDPADIWHEKQFTSSGLHVGLSPIANAARTIGNYLDAERFAQEWFNGGGVPRSELKNVAKTLDPTEADEVKRRFKANIANGDVFVHGADWEFNMLQAAASDMQFLETMKASVSDVCRFLGVPGDMIDAEVTTGSITYANVTQRNLQLLILNLGPAITRRERALSDLLPRPRFVKLNTDAVVLRMDPTSRAEMNKTLIESRQRTASEIREKDDLPPYTPEQIAEFHELFPPKQSVSAPGVDAVTGVPA
jgi:HK97 family phage portal protein